MANKPPVLCNLERGKLISAQRHFVDTFNWIVDFASQMKGLTGIVIKDIDKGQPKISIALEGGEGVELVEDKNTGKITVKMKEFALNAGNGISISEDKKKRERTISAKIVAGDNVEITNEDGAIKISAEGGGEHYIKGNDTNIVFTPSESGTMIDVYYS